MVERSGPFTRAQARAAGFGEAAIRRFVRGGCWVPLRHGVFVHESQMAAVHGDARRRHALDVSAVLLTVGVPAVAAATSAARIIGIELLYSPADVVVATASLIKGGRRRGAAPAAGVGCGTGGRTGRVLELGRYRPGATGRRHLGSAGRVRARVGGVQAEKRREEWLSDAGFEVVRWGWEDARDPERLARRLTAAFARGAERAWGRRRKLAS